MASKVYSPGFAGLSDKSKNKSIDKFHLFMLFKHLFDRSNSEPNHEITFLVTNIDSIYSFTSKTPVFMHLFKHPLKNP